MTIGIYSFFKQGNSLGNFLSPCKKIKETTTKYKYLLYIDNLIPCLHFTEQHGVYINLDICEVDDKKVQKWAEKFNLIPKEILTKDDEQITVYFKNNNFLNLGLITKGMIDE